MKTHPVHYISVLVTYCILSIPMFFTFFDILEGPDSLKEEGISSTPNINEGVKKTFTDFRHYIKTRYDLKNEFITIFSLGLDWSFSKIPYQNVIKGKDGFLFLKNAEATNSHQRIGNFTGNEINDWIATVNQAVALAEKYDSNYYLMVAPNKHSIYPELLPYWLTKQTTQPSRADQILSALHVEGKQAIDLRPALATAKVSSSNTLFYKTDTHWNELGASYGAEEIREFLQLKKNETPPIVYENGRPSGDLARMIGWQDIIFESYLSPGDYEHLQCLHFDGSKLSRNQIDPYFPSPRIVNCVNENSRNTETAVIFMDSFGVSLIPSLANIFSKSTFVWRYSLDEEIIAKEKPDYVLQLIVERKFHSVTAQDIIKHLR